jgi:hypothetical protein
MLDALLEIYRSIPPHPVAPELRGVARLCPSAYVKRGLMYRLVPRLLLSEDEGRPLIVMNTDDVDELRQLLVTPFWRDVDQEIADMAEQLFALQEAQS